jgi:arabinofuranosyltransferase
LSGAPSTVEPAAFRARPLWGLGSAPDVVVVLAAALPLVLFLVTERRVAGVSGFPLDDSWIHLHFARNLAEGAGFSYNPGRPVAGSTAPLWTLLLGGVAAIAGASVTMAKLVGVACAVGAGLLTHRAARAWGAPPVASVAAGIALLWAGPIAWGALSGMEVTLAALLVAGALVAHASDRAWLTATLAGLALLARPEAAVLLPALLLSRPLTPVRIAAFVLVPAIVIAPLVAFSYATVGTPYPATAAAKIQGGLIGWLGGLREPLVTTVVVRPWTFVREWAVWLWRTHPLLPLALLPAMALAWRRRGAALGVFSLALLAHPLAMALLAPYRGPGFQEGRYSIHLLPLALVVVAVGIGTALPSRRRAASVAWLALALWGLPAAADRYAWGVQNIEAMQVSIGHWVHANVPPTARLAVNDIGAIAYVSRREIVDLMGLATPEILPYRRQGEEGVIRFVGEACPDYVIIFPTWFPLLAARGDLLEVLHRVRLDRVEVSGGPEMVVYRLRRCGV